MRYAGVDEVGYGALAGPIVSVAVAIDVNVRFEDLRRWWPLADVRDSKKTTEVQRQRLMPVLQRYLLENGASVGVGEVSAADIDRYGYKRSLELTKLEALRDVIRDARPDMIIVDGSVGLPSAGVLDIEQRVVPRADADYWVVAAASILAKVYRDDQMREMAQEFPAYDWVHNKGYAGGSAQQSVHVRALVEHGLSPHHRRIACRTILS